MWLPRQVRGCTTHRTNTTCYVYVHHTSLRLLTAYIVCISINHVNRDTIPPGSYDIKIHFHNWNREILQYAHFTAALGRIYYFLGLSRTKNVTGHVYDNIVYKYIICIYIISCVIYISLLIFPRRYNNYTFFSFSFAAINKLLFQIKDIDIDNSNMITTTFTIYLYLYLSIYIYISFFHFN